MASRNPLNPVSCTCPCSAALNPRWRQRLAYGVRPNFRSDLLQYPYAGTERRVAIVLNDLGQLPDRRVCLFVCEVQGSCTNGRGSKQLLTKVFVRFLRKLRQFCVYLVLI
jgi:hypothetical protein